MDYEHAGSDHPRQLPYHLAAQELGLQSNPTEGQVPAPLNQGIQAKFLDHFGKAFDGESRRAMFTCSGKILLSSLPNETETPTTINIRWGAQNSGEILSLPVTNDQDAAKLDKLIQDCKPATFGRDGRDVYDESYRRAGAMSTNDFMTDFCPYRTGIIDEVVQLLLPAITGELEIQPYRSAVSEKYNLNDKEESEIHYVLVKLARQKQDYILTQDVQRCLSALKVLPASTEETLRILGELDPMGAGYTLKSDFIDVAAARLTARRPRAGVKHDFNVLDPAGQKKRMLNRCIRAELYKLNVYSGPSGLFKPHVDTPRSDLQIGSLVVCLPVGFEGGALMVRHSGQEVMHEWSRLISDYPEPAIQWAAFYSDCEHEVREVTAGHRVTLTYNLYLAPGTGLLTGQPLSLEPAQLPLVKDISSLLANENFMYEGGCLGVNLAHRYPHTHPSLHHFVPSMLKGVDMALCEAIFALNLQCKLMPTGGRSEVYGEDIWDTNWPRHDGRNSNTLHPVESALIPLWTTSELRDGVRDSDDEDDYGWNESDQSDTSDIEQRVIKERRQAEREKTRVVWVNEKRFCEMSAAYMAYGNQAELKTKYSSVALIIKIPNWLERQASGTAADPVMIE